MLLVDTEIGCVARSGVVANVLGHHPLDAESCAALRVRLSDLRDGGKGLVALNRELVNAIVEGAGLSPLRRAFSLQYAAQHQTRGGVTMKREWDAEFDAVAKKVHETNRMMLEALAAISKSKDSRDIASSEAFDNFHRVSEEWERVMEEERRLIADFRKEQ